MAYFGSFTEQEIPYGILEKFGLSHEMIDDLPQAVMQRFLSSRTTPVLPVVSENAEGQKVRTMARISLVRLTDGTVDVCFAPQWEDEDLSDFTPEQQEKLKLGNATTAQMPEKGRCFVQFDDTINQVMAIPVGVINHNIGILARSFGLDETDKETLEEGGVVEMNLDGDIIAAGIDLYEPTGIRFANGDIIAWQNDVKADKLPKYNFGIFGCWVADDDNFLTYVPEDDYTQEMIDEQKRMGLQNAAGEKTRQLHL